MNNKKLLISIFLIVFIDLLGFSVILPLLPFYAQTFGANAITTELLVAIYALAQFFSAPLLGRLSDRLGRRPVLMISIAGNLLGFLILGFANSLLILFLARALAGFTGGNISVAQAYISDVTDEKNRAKGLGLIGAAFGLGFIVGPAAGGILSQFGYAVPAFLAAGLSLLNLLLVGFWLPESLSLEKREVAIQNKKPPFNMAAMLQALRRPVVGPLLHSRFIFAVAFSMFSTVFALYGLYRFNLDSQNTGYILAYVGVLSVIVQGGLIGQLTKRFSETNLLFWSVLMMTAALIGWALAPSILVLLIVLIPTALAGGIFNTVINSQLTKSVARDEMGGILGLASSLESASRVIAPALGGLLLQNFGTGAPGWFSAALVAWLASYFFRFIYRKVIPLGEPA